MKFSSILAFATLALAASISLEERQATVVGTLVQSVSTAKTAMTANTNAINSALSNSQQSTTQLATQLTSYFKTIATLLQMTGSAMSASTRSAAGSTQSGATGLSQTQMNNMAGAMNNAQQLVTSLQGAFTNVANNGKLATNQMLSNEMTAAKNSVAPFANPLQSYASAVMSQSHNTGGLAILQTALSSFQSSLQAFYASVGLPASGIPTTGTS